MLHVPKAGIVVSWIIGAQRQQMPSASRGDGRENGMAKGCHAPARTDATVSGQIVETA